MVAPAAAQPVAGSYDAKWRREADAAAERWGVPQMLFRALVDAESGWNERARSSKGAIGLTQLMPATARSLGVDPFDPAQNLDGGARYLRQRYDTFGDWELALAAYNAGDEAVKTGRWRQFRETTNYVAKVMRSAGDFVELKLEDWLEPAAGVNVDKVNADLLGRLFLLGAYLEKRVRITSGYRTDAEQTRIWDSGKRPAAKPISRGGDGSNHTRGGAVDATIDGRPIGAAVDEATLASFGLRSLANDPVHVEPVLGADAQAAGMGPGAALVAAAAAARTLGPKVATRLKGLLGKLKGGGAVVGGVAAGSRLGDAATLGAVLALLGVTGAVDLKRAALWLAITLVGLALVLLGVLRMVGIAPGRIAPAGEGAA